jgi:glyoxylase-like metal-dependent hydrolase (beta-lactamase superfamily II)
MPFLPRARRLACALLLGFAAAAAMAATLPPWQPGNLDIHHLGTGRGNATFIVLPDGSSMLIDAGASASGPEVSSPARPDASRRPGEWIARYIKRHLPPSSPLRLDYLLVTHFHPDHVGDAGTEAPLSRHGGYRLSGAMDVAEAIPVGTLLDRGYPDYSYPAPIGNMGPFADNYLRFVESRRKQGLQVERIAVGSGGQITPLHGASPAFSVRAIAANGEVWDGKDGTVHLFPPLDGMPPDDVPNENTCSIALKFSYGPFSYFTAGDLTSYTFDGALPWRDVLGAAARVAGPVDVSTADHHGMFDGLSADVVRRLRPRAWVIPAWHISHPDMLQLERMFSKRLYPGPRDVYANGVMAANQLANHRLLARAKALDGHIVVRVAPGGGSFTVYVTDNRDERDTVLRADGPYPSGQN